MDEVRDAVVEDAKKLAAFSLQIADRDTWRAKLSEKVIQEIAKDLDVKVEEPAAFQRRAFSMGGAGCWQMAVHYPDLFFAANPGAGFSETPEFLRFFQKETL